MTIRVGVVGLGYWGPNLMRALNGLDGCELVWCCDTDSEARARFARHYPTTRFTSTLDDLLADSTLDAVVLATPVHTHAALADRALSAGKHCLVEKPLTQSSESAVALVSLAEEKGLILMVGHLLEYHPAVQRLAQLIEEGDLGEVRYIYTQRLNLGKLRDDENALWSLGAHDLSVVLRLTDEEPVEVSAQGGAYLRSGVEDVVFAHMRFGSGISAHLHLSWLDPNKERRITVVGSKRMATFDDMELDRKLTVYDRGFDPDELSYGDYVARSGDVLSIAVPKGEPLAIECNHFIESIREEQRPLSDGLDGLRVVRVLEALQASLDAGGVPREPGPAQVSDLTERIR